MLSWSFTCFIDAKWLLTTKNWSSNHLFTCSYLRETHIRTVQCLISSYCPRSVVSLHNQSLHRTIEMFLHFIDMNTWTSLIASIAKRRLKALTVRTIHIQVLCCSQQSCPNLTVFVNCLVKLNLSYDKKIKLQTNSLYFRYVKLGKYIVKVQFNFFYATFQPNWVLLVYIYFVRHNILAT